MVQLGGETRFLIGAYIAIERAYSQREIFLPSIAMFFGFTFHLKKLKYRAATRAKLWGNVNVCLLGRGAKKCQQSAGKILELRLRYASLGLNPRQLKRGWTPTQWTMQKSYSSSVFKAGMKDWRSDGWWQWTENESRVLTGLFAQTSTHRWYLHTTRWTDSSQFWLTREYIIGP